MRKLAVAAVLGGLVLMATPGYAVAETSTNQRFTIVSVNEGAATVIASGALTAVGTEADNRDQVPPGSPFQGSYSFPQGALFVTVAGAGRPQVQLDPSTCVTRLTIIDTSRITGGTGAFAGASGSSTDTVHVTTIGGRSDDGQCLGPQSPPLFELSIIQTAGTLTLP